MTRITVVSDDEFQARIDTWIEDHLNEEAFQESVGNFDDAEWLVFTPYEF